MKRQIKKWTIGAILCAGLEVGFTMADVGNTYCETPKLFTHLDALMVLVVLLLPMAIAYMAGKETNPYE